MSVPTSFIYRSILSVLLSPFTTVYGHYLLAWALACDPKTPAPVSFVRACDVYSRTHYTSTYVASAIGLAAFLILRTLAGHPEIPTSAWYLIKIVAAAAGSLLVWTPPISQSKLQIIDNSGLLDPASMLAAALVGQTAAYIIVRAISTTAFWRKINRLVA